MAVNQDFYTNPDFFEPHAQDSLVRYVQNLHPDVVSQLSKPQSQDVIRVMEQNISGLLGNLPSEHFDMAITTSKENLGRLLASAMISGYFLRNAELRHSFERSVDDLANSGTPEVPPAEA
ncbi:DUF760 domain-containing protein [Prochlorothrix hollandica]|uniref:DUF760 domain-containing protein n=1 Tax=Prochlorothrix hollandica TaxID=1223 RepID=UPI0003644BA0